MQAISELEMFFLKEIKQMLSNQLPNIVALFIKQNINTLLLAKKC